MPPSPWCTTGATQGTFGSSSELSRRLDEYQFTFGEGPCLDAVADGRPVLVPDLSHPAEQRWPAFTPAVLSAGVHAVFALPATVATTGLGVLDLFRRSPGRLSADDLAGGLFAAELASLPLLELLRTNWPDADDGGAGLSQLASMERVEVYQATGMIMAQLVVGPTEALLRLRAHAFVSGQTASEVAWEVVERRLSFRPGGSGHDPSDEASSR